MEENSQINKVSIIIPVYNSEMFLARCIESILNQTYNDIELILINDGSIDNSGVICDYYANIDNRVQVIHQQNKGVSAARNAGIKLASGKYLQFVDSDDYIEKNMTAILIKAIKNNSASMVICGYKSINPSGKQLEKHSWNKGGLYSFNEMLNFIDQLFRWHFINPLWNKLYLSEIIRNQSILFDENLSLGEDLLFNLEVIKKANNFEIIPDSPYNYIRYNTDTLSNKRREDMYYVQKLLFEKKLSLFHNFPKSYSHQIKNLEMQYSKLLLSNLFLYFADLYGWEDFRLYKKKAKEIGSDKILNKTIKNIESESIQSKLIKFLIEKKLYAIIFVYSKVKKYLRNKMPEIYKLLRKLEGG